MTFHLEGLDLLLPYLLAFGLGGLIGLERERHRKEKNVLAGVRTYPMIALAGVLATDLAGAIDAPLLISVTALVMGAFALQMYWVRQKHGTLGLTSPVALFVTYFVGVLIGVGRTFEAVAVGLGLTLLLFTRERLHQVAEVLKPREMEGALYFLILAFVLYPLLPTEPIDPWDLLELRRILLIVLLVSLISFVSFLALRRWGSRYGIGFSGLMGGLVNSEAVAASLAGLAKRQKELVGASVLGTLLATGTLFLRNLIIAAIADPSLGLAGAMLLPMLVTSLVLLVWTLPLGKEVPKTVTPIELRSPFAFRPALVFAFWFTLVSVLAVLLTRFEFFGERVVYVAALGGLVSAGAVVASMGALVATGHAPVGLAAGTAILASLVSAANKPFIARLLGPPELSRRLVLPTVGAVAVGLAGLAALVWWF